MLMEGGVRLTRCSCGSCFNVCPGDSPYCVSGKCRNNPPVLVKFRIEGNEQDGTLFEGEIATAGHDVSTPLGGTHHCDGTNDNASPTRGGTFTSALDDAARLNRFNFDGTFYPSKPGRSGSLSRSMADSFSFRRFLHP